MARINIDDSLFNDPRFMDLVQRLGPEVAIGSLVLAYKCAQRFWVPRLLPIPSDQFRLSKLRQEIIEVGLAEIRENGSVYIKGTEEQFAWLIQRSKAGRENKGKSVKRKRTEPNGTERNRSSYSSSYSSSSSSSVSSSNSAIAAQSTQAAPDLSPEDRLRGVVAVWCSEYKRRYGVQYRVTGKDIGILKRLLGGIGSPDTLCRIIVAYLGMADSWFINKRHDVATLEANLAKVSEYEQSGQLVTQSQIRDLDRKTTHQAIIEKARRGEI